MWQAPSRARAVANQRKRDRIQRPIHLKRVTAELALRGAAENPEPAPEVRLLLNDLSPHGIGLFANAPVLVGQEITLKLDHPKPIEIHGRVAWCQENSGEGHIMSEKPFSFRLGIEFLFANQEDEKRVIAYCEDLATNHLYTLRAA